MQSLASIAAIVDDASDWDDQDDSSGVAVWMLAGLIAAIILRPWDFFPPLAALKPVTVSLLGITGLLMASGTTIRYFRLPLSRCLLVVWVIMFVGILNPYIMGTTLDFAVKYVQFLMLFALIGTLVANYNSQHLILRTLAAVGIALGLLAVRAKMTGQLSDDGRIEGLGTGLLSDPNDLASMLVTIVPLTWYFGTQSKRLVDRGLGLISVATLVIGIAVTQSRGGLIALIVAGGFLLLISRASIAKKAALVAVVCLTGVAMLPADLADRYASIGSAAQSDESAQSRLAVWIAGSKIFADHPIIGVGVTNFEVVYGSRYIDRSGAGDVWRSAHNSVVEAAAELGAIGLAGWIGFMFGGVPLLWRARRRSTVQIEEWEDAHQQVDIDMLDIDERQAMELLHQRVETQMVWSECMMASLIGFLVSAMFLSKAFDISTVIFVGLAVAGQQSMSRDQNQMLIYTDALEQVSDRSMVSNASA